MSFDKENWTLLGKDLDAMSMALNPDVKTTKNILGETTVNNNGYSPELALDSYKARTEDKIYEHIKDIAMNRKTDEESTGAYLLESILTDEVKNSDSTVLTGEAWMENVVVVTQEYGGDTSGFDIPFTIHMNGGRVAGTVSVDKRVPTFTEGTVDDGQTVSETGNEEDEV